MVVKPNECAIACFYWISGVSSIPLLKSNRKIYLKEYWLTMLYLMQLLWCQRSLDLINSKIKSYLSHGINTFINLLNLVRPRLPICRDQSSNQQTLVKIAVPLIQPPNLPSHLLSHSKCSIVNPTTCHRRLLILFLSMTHKQRPPTANSINDIDIISNTILLVCHTYRSK